MEFNLCVQCVQSVKYIVTRPSILQGQKIISVRILFTLIVLTYVYLNLTCPTYTDIFKPDGKYVSVTVEKGTN